MAIEVGTNSTGLIVGVDVKGFFDALRRKSDKIVPRQRIKTYERNTHMSALVRAAGDLPLIGKNGKPVIDIPSYIRPPKWRDARLTVNVYYYEQGIRNIAETTGIKVYPFTLNLSPGFTRNALSKGGMDYIRRRIYQTLTRAVKRDVDFWFILETAMKCRDNSTSRHSGRPHIHGSLALDPGEAPLVRSAFRTMNASKEKIFRQNELRFSPPNKAGIPSIGWAQYCTKYIYLTPLFLPGMGLVTYTNSVTREAQKIYESDRKIIRALGRSSSSTSNAQS